MDLITETVSHCLPSGCAFLLHHPDRSCPGPSKINQTQETLLHGSDRELGKCACLHAELLQSCPTLCDPMDCSSPGSSVHGISPGKETGVDSDSLL